MKNKTIWYHADDFGVSIEQSEKILACFTNGALNSISILPNVPDLKGAHILLEKTDTKCELRRVLHLNFVEGKPLAGADKVPLLTNDRGYFDKSFVKLFIWNYTAGKTKRGELKRQLCKEIREQLRAVTSENDFHITAIDSHQHYHMIPIVFDCIMSVINEAEFKALDIRQIRIPVDPLKPVLFFRDRTKISPVNMLKWLILKTSSRRNRLILRKNGIEAPVFFGIFYTCEMKWDIVKVLLPLYKKYADRRNENLELMFHPGNLTAKYEMLDINRNELWEFYASDNRFAEAQCLKMLDKNDDCAVFAQK